jgi:molecular chaperone DnaJ
MARPGCAVALGGGAGYHHVDLSEALNIFMRDFGLGDLFGAGGGGGRSSQGPRTGADVKVDLELTMLEVATGVTKNVKIKLLDPCETCTGTGAEKGTQATRCTTCAGAGEVRRAQQSFFGQFVSVAPCPTCRGEGVMIASPCKSCRGEGRQRGDHNIEIKVPAGVATGQYMHLRGVGNAGVRGGPRGDVLVVFEVIEDDRFERDGEDLYCEVLLSYPQAVLGADVGIAVSGVAGPEPHEGFDPGALWIAIHLDGASEAINLTLPFDRERIRQFTCIMALNLLRTRLLEA